MKKIYNCDLLNSGLHFTPDKLQFCCAPAFQGPNIVSKNPDKKDIFIRLLRKRENALSEMQNHIAPKDCVGCPNLIEYDSDSSEISNNKNGKFLISYIVINHFKQCDSHCIYCSQFNYLKKIVTEPQKSEYYDLYPIIKQFYKEKLIDKKNLVVEFQGGSIGVLKEFPDLVKIFLKNNVKEILFFTNGIKFLPQIVDAAKKTKVKVICSIDAGTRETFKRIKIADKFYDVINNLKKYSDKCINIQINAKYILLEGFNDNKKEILSFFDAITFANLPIAQLDMDYKKIMINKGVRYDIPKHYYELYDFFKEQCVKNNIVPSVNNYIQEILDKGYFE